MPPVRSRPLLYLVCSLALIITLVLAKGGIAWVSESYIYSLPMIGGLFKSLEVLELSNIIIFALLGLGLGAATVYLSHRTPIALRGLLLVLAIPIVFSASYWVRQTLWIQAVSETANIPHQQAVQLTNQVLRQETGTAGFIGFFRYTTRVPLLPTSPSELQQLAEDERWLRSELTRFSGVEPGIFSMAFESAGWGIRGFYMLLALLTAVIYFVKGQTWAEAARLRRASRRS
ncbi:hypothetical protein [Halomicronema hongdechloris]|nr:hypothetical protein [Halomicronema hongdechloris]